MDVNRISGYIPGKMVFFLMQVLDSACPPHTRDVDQLSSCSLHTEHWSAYSFLSEMCPACLRRNAMRCGSVLQHLIAEFERFTWNICHQA